MKAETFFKKLTDKEAHICFLHSKSKDGWGSMIAWNPVEKFSYKTGEKNKLLEFVKKNNKKKRKLIGYISYDIGYELYDVKKTAKDDLNLPDICFFAFENWVYWEKGIMKIHSKDQKFIKEVKRIKKRSSFLSKNIKSPNRNFKTSITKKQYTNAYNKIKEYIKDGDIYQINLTHRLEAQTNLHSRKLFSKVIERNPVDFLAYIEGDNFEILSASPERFIRVKDKSIETCPVKGTRPRGKTQKEDIKNKKELIESEKEAAELNMITDLLRNDLGKISEIGSVKVTGSRLISKCPTVWHTYSVIKGEIAKNITPIKAVISMLPGGSITGCPKKRAMEIIDELEPTTRSVYTGVIGYIDPNQNCDFNIAIRTIIKKGPMLYLQVGGGIVIDSSNNAEFQETLDKAKSFMKILC